MILATRNNIFHEEKKYDAAYLAHLQSEDTLGSYETIGSRKKTDVNVIYNENSYQINQTKEFIKTKILEEYIEASNSFRSGLSEAAIGIDLVKKSIESTTIYGDKNVELSKNLIEIEKRIKYFLLGKDDNLSKIENNYYFTDDEKVTDFLCEKSYLLPILAEAYQQIRSIFQDEPKLSLSVEEDPELQDLITLSLSIHVGNKVDFDRVDSSLGKLDDEWWVEASLSAPDLNIDVKFNEL